VGITALYPSSVSLHREQASSWTFTYITYRLIAFSGVCFCEVEILIETQNTVCTYVHAYNTYNVSRHDTKRHSLRTIGGTR